MRSHKGLNFFFNSVLCSQFFFLSSDIFSLLHFLETLTQETSWDIDRGQHLYTSTLEWALAFSTQETSWDIDRGWTSYCIFLRYQPKRHRETSTEGKHLYTSTLEWALVFSFHPRDIVRHQPREDILLRYLEISTQETSWDIDRRKISRHIYPGMGSCSFL